MVKPRKGAAGIFQCGGNKDKEKTYENKRKNKVKKVLMKNFKSKDIQLNANDLRFPIRKET